MVLSQVKEINLQGQDISQDSIAERSERYRLCFANPNQMISQTMILDEVALGLRLQVLKRLRLKRACS